MIELACVRGFHISDSLGEIACYIQRLGIDAAGIVAGLQQVTGINASWKKDVETVGLDAGPDRGNLSVTRNAIGVLEQAVSGRRRERLSK